MAKFEIVELLGKEYRTVAEAGTFDSGVKAAVEAERLSKLNPGQKFQPRIVKENTDWTQRELSRFASGDYEGLPWGDQLPLIDRHFAHRAKKNSDNIAYTPDDEYGQQDRKISIHVNSYLNRFYPELPVETRRRLVRVFTRFDPVKFLKFATSADEIETVYTNGPGSCMAHSSSDFASEEHPVRMYYGNGLTLAYIERSEGDYTARAIVHTERKIYARVYGDEELLVEVLESLGYRKGLYGVDWCGVEIDAIWEEDQWDEGEEEYTSGYVCPYVDFASRARVDEERGKLVFGLTGDICVHGTNGLSYMDNYPWKCPCCERDCSGGQTYGPGNSFICDDCAHEMYGHCAETGFVFNEVNQGVRCEDGSLALKDHTIHCTITGKIYRVSKCTQHGGRYRTPEEMTRLKEGLAA